MGGIIKRRKKYMRGVYNGISIVGCKILVTYFRAWMNTGDPRVEGVLGAYASVH